MTLMGMMKMLETVPKAVATRRLANVRTLAARYDTQVDLAVALGLTKSGLNQLIGPNPIRPISERMARRFEKRLRLAPDTLDTEPVKPSGAPGAPAHQPTPYSPLEPMHEVQILDTVMRAADDAKKRVGLILTDEKYRALVSILFKSAARSGGQVDAAEVDNLVRLMT